MRSLPYATPLHRHLILETKSPLERTRALSQITQVHSAELVEPRKPFRSKVYGAAGAQALLSTVSTLGSLRLRAHPSETAYLLVFGLKGSSIARSAGRLVWVTPDTGLVLSPMCGVDVWTAVQAETVFLRFEQETVIRELEKLMDRHVSAPLMFDPGIDMKTEAGARLRQSAMRLCKEVNRLNPGEATRSLGVQTIENVLLAVLIEGHKHNYTRLLSRDSEAGPWQLRIAEEYIRANAQLPISLGDIAAVAGVSARTLQYSFQQRRGCGPMQFVRATRLNMVRTELLAADETTTVSEVACRWGLLHFGRFAAEYQTVFGEKPSTTLANTKARRRDPVLRAAPLASPAI